MGVCVTMAKLYCFLLVIHLKLFVNTAEQITKTSLNDENVDGSQSLIDSFIDLAIEKIQIKEPIVIPNVVQRFDKKVLKIPLKGELALSNGNLTGVKTIRRVDQAYFTMLNAYEADANCSFYFEKLEFTYEYQANIINKEISSSGIVNIQLQQLSTNANIIISSKSRTIELTSLTFKSEKSINLKLQDKNHKDRNIINATLKLFFSSLKETILETIQEKLNSILTGHRFHY